MAGLSFDDLVPAQTAPARAPGGVSFDDLIPSPTDQVAEMMNGSSAPGSGAWDFIKSGAKNAAQAADDTVRLMTNGMTLGYMDKAAAAGDSALGSGDYATNLAAERAKSQAASDRAGWAGAADGALGMVAPAGLIGKGVGAVAGAADGVPLLGRILASPYTQAAATGAGVGAANATGNDTDPTTGALVGAGAGVGGQALASAIMGTVGKVAGAFNAKPQIPTGDELSAAAQKAYADSENAGVIVNPAATQRLAATIKQTMADHGYDPSLEPGGAAVLNSLGQMDGQNATLKGVDTLRKVAGRMWQGSPSGANLGAKIQGNIDDFADSLTPSDLVGGNGPQGVEALNNARSLYSSAAKNSDLEEALTNAANRASVTGSGGNIDNATRQNVLRLMNSRDNWTPDEKSALQDIVSGTPTQNALRLLGKLSPEGNGLMMSLEMGGAAMGAAHGGPLEAAMATAVPAIGFGAKHIADGMTASRAQTLGEIIRSGGDASATQAAPNAVQQFAQSKAQLLARAIMGAGIGDNSDSSQASRQNLLARALGAVQ